MNAFGYDVGMMMKIRMNAPRLGRQLTLGIALATGALFAANVPAFAQTTTTQQPSDPQAQRPPDARPMGPMPDSQPMDGPLPEAWDAAWENADTVDRTHFVIGTVASFTPYRLLVARASGETTQVDLKNGTIIRPTGLQLAPGERVAVIGYWSKGTFIANRIVLRHA